MNTIKNTIITFCAVLLFVQLNAEEKRSISVTGKILDSNSTEPIEYATVTIYNLQDELLTGTITRADGSFEVESPTPDFYIQVKFIGYEALNITDFKIDRNKVDIATRNLKPYTQGTVQTFFIFLLDYNVYNTRRSFGIVFG